MCAVMLIMQVLETEVVVVSICVGSCGVRSWVCLSRDCHRPQQDTRALRSCNISAWLVTECSSNIFPIFLRLYGGWLLSTACGRVSGFMPQVWHPGSLSCDHTISPCTPCCSICMSSNNTDVLIVTVVGSCGVMPYYKTTHYINMT